MKTKKIISHFASWGVYITLSIVVVGVIVASTMVINYLRQEEINHVQLFAEAQKLLSEDSVQDPDVQLLLLNILNDNHSIPVVVTDRFNNPILMKNIPESVIEDSEKSRKMIRDMEKSYPPIEVKLPSGNNQYIFFTNSRLMNALRFYPYALGLIIVAYLAFSWWFLNTVKKSSEGFLWAGLAKETAHQIGTPLSSMIGWIEILRMENENSQGVQEIEKDIHRLKTISERFSKIGSIPELNDLNIKETLQQNFEYLKTRISKKVHFTLEMPSHDILIPHSRILLSWVIENLVKNAVDAMKGEGSLKLSLIEKSTVTIIDLMDTGSGMSKAQMRDVFKPGYSTKKRGWGLGLSLAKRAINDYHNGELKVQYTELGKGTTFRILLAKR